MITRKSRDLNDLSNYNTFVNPDSKSNLPGDTSDEAVIYGNPENVETRHRILPKRDEFNENAVRDFASSIGTPSVVAPFNSGDSYKIPYRTVSTPGEMYNMSDFRDNIHQRRTIRIASDYLFRQAGFVVYFDRSPLQTGRSEQDGSSLPGDASFQSTVLQNSSITRPEESQPGELFAADLLPGTGSSSAKVIPYDGGFSNYKTAKTYAQIVRNLSSGVEDRAKGLKVYKEESTGPKQTYRVAFKPEYDGFTVDILTGDDKHPLQSKMLALKCNCPAWRFHGSEYWAKQEGYLLGKNRGSGEKPRMRDPKARNKVCKHVVAVFKHLNKKKK